MSRDGIAGTREHRAIQDWYGDRCARRSGVPLLRHIEEGLAILERLGATDAAMRAFCLHPLLQADADLAANAPRLHELTTDAHVAALAFEYRHIANRAPATRSLGSAEEIALSPLREVNDMLIADKVQNRKDFLLHHRGRHPRSAALERYFDLWLARLGISEARFAELCAP